MAENAMTPADLGAVLGNRWGYPYGGSGFGFGGGDGGPYVILVNTPCDLAYAVSSASVAVTTTETTGD